VNGENIEKLTDKTIRECQALCSANTACLGVEFFEMKSNGATVSPNGAYAQGACTISSGIDTAGCDSDAMQLTLWVKGDVLTCDDVNVEFCYGVGGCRPENDTTMDPYERFTTWDAADCTAVCAMSPGCASSAYNTYVA